MSTYFLSPPAEADLQGIFDHIASDRPRAAVRVTDRIMRRIESLATHPLSGEAQPQFGPGIRFSTVENYVVVYRPVPDGVEVVRIIHGARDIDALLH